MRRLTLFAVMTLLVPPVAGSPALERAIRACDSDAAIEALSRSDRSDPIERLYDSGRVDLLRGHTARAVEKLERVVDGARGVSDHHLWYSRALFARAGEASTFRRPFLARKAIAELERAREIDRRNDHAAIDLLLIHLRIPLLGGGRDEADRLVRELEQQRSPYATFARGILAYEDERWDIAETELSRAAETLDDPRRALFWIGFLYQRLQRWNDAFDSHRRLLELSPHDPRVWYEFGRTAEFSDQHSELGRAMIRRYLAANLPSGAPTKEEARALLARIRSE